MSSLSPAYREDSTDGLPIKVRDYLDKHFLANVVNVQTKNPKLLVVFAGGNAVGKSTLSAKIGAELDGLVLENDAIKRRLLQFDPKIARDTLNTLTWKYSMDLYRRLSTLTSNGLIVRDGIIHWYFDRILPIFEEQGYQLFIISMEPSKKKRIELIKARGNTDTTGADRLISIIPDHEIHMERFKKAYTPDVVLTDNNLFDHDAVLEKLRERLTTLSQ